MKSRAVHLMTRDDSKSFWAKSAHADVKGRMAAEKALGIETSLRYLEDDDRPDPAVTHVFLEQIEASPDWIELVEKRFPKARTYFRLHAGPDSPAAHRPALSWLLAPKRHREMVRLTDFTLGMADTETHQYWRMLAGKSEAFRTLTLLPSAASGEAPSLRRLALADAAFGGETPPTTGETLARELVSRFESAQTVSDPGELRRYEGLALLDPKSRGFLPEVLRRTALGLPVWLSYPLFDQLPLEAKAFCLPLSEAPSRAEIATAEEPPSSYQPGREIESRVRAALEWIFDRPREVDAGKTA